MLAVLEYAPVDLLGDGWRRTTHKDDSTRIAEMYQALNRGLGGIWKLRALSRSGDNFGTVVNATPTPLGVRVDGRIVEAVARRSHMYVQRSMFGDS